MFPAEEAIGDVRKALAKGESVVLSAPPGSGKTTCIPPSLLNEPWLAGRKIIMLEPRRIAARSCAMYMSARLGERVGETIGYRVRLENATSPSTKLEIVTEGMLSRKILSDPELSDTGLVIFDEFHERSLQCDFSFALSLEVKNAFRPDLRLLVMSATMDVDLVASRLPSAKIIRAEGRMFPVETRYLGDVSMSAAIHKASKETDGDILCFLPGEGEIHRTAESVAGIQGFDVVKLFGSLPKQDQDAVFNPIPGRRRVILSTSIAETSVTIPGIRCVIDCGLMRTQRFSPSTGMNSLVTLPLPLDRARQRAGRAGRTAPGVCYRLWNEAEEKFRSRTASPEILDADLSSLVLGSAAWGALRREDLPWPTMPPAASWDGAAELLRSLGALDRDGRLSPQGERMAKLSVHPRLAAMLLASSSGDELAVASVLAAILEEGSKSRETDICRIYDEIVETPKNPFSRRILELGRRMEKSAAPFCSRSAGRAARSEGSLLAFAYPDRIAKNRGNGSFRMSSGRGAVLDKLDPLAKSPYLVCCELDGKTGDARIFRAASVSAEELEDIFGDAVSTEKSCKWDRKLDGVKCTVCRKIGEVILDEKPDLAADSDGIASCLMKEIRQRGIDLLPCRTPFTDALRARLKFAHERMSWPEIGDGAILDSMEGFLSGVRRWNDLEKIDFASVISYAVSLAGHDRRELDRIAPERIVLPRGRSVPVDYSGSEPEAEARLQDCFGMTETPKVGDGTVPVVMNLLSPARRPIQRTKDLAGFWRESYQLVRKDMRGRYPKHSWPENPLSEI